MSYQHRIQIWIQEFWANLPSQRKDKDATAKLVEAEGWAGRAQERRTKLGYYALARAVPAGSFPLQGRSES